MRSRLELNQEAREELRVRHLLGDPLTQDETAALMGISRARVAQLEERALQKLGVTLQLSEWEELKP